MKSYRSQYAKLPQIHYVGSADKVIPPFLVRKFVKNDNLVVEVSGATHNQGWKSIFETVCEEKQPFCHLA